MTDQLSLAQKLAKISKEIGAIPKEKKPGASVSYAYRGIDDVMNKLNPLLSEYGITLQSKVLSHTLTPRTFIKYDKYEKRDVEKTCYYATAHLQLIFSDGNQQEVFEEVAMSEDYGDKALTQAMSMAYKYAITRKFCILTQDTVDPDSRQPEHELQDAVAKLANCNSVDELTMLKDTLSESIVKHPKFIAAAKERFNQVKAA